MSDQFELVCSELEKQTGYTPKGAKDRRKAKCPAHDDATASLSVRDDEVKGKIGVTCFAGCTFEEVVKALDMSSSDFRIGGGKSPRPPREPSEPPPSKGDREIARYVYTDEAGTPLYHNVRFEPKTFRMAGPDGVIRGLPKNLQRVPYNLPRVLQAVERQETVWWVEGEKDVNRLGSLGLAATTSAGGANTPVPDEWADYFRGATVVSVCDRDKSGRAYARAVGRMLVNAASSWRAVEPRTPQPKSDVSDHLDAGYGMEALVSVPMRSVRRTKWTISAVLETKPEPLNWVLNGLVPEGLTLLVGAPKAGKSWFNMGLLVALATGRPDLVFDWGQPHEPAPSLYLALEDPHRRVHDRMIKVVSSLDFDSSGAGDIWLDLPPINAGGREEIERWLEANPTARCIMVDVLAKVRGQQDTSGGLYQADYEAVGALKEIADEYGLGVVVTHHDRKKVSDDFVDMVSGTKGVTGAADTILYLTRERGTNKGILKLESRDVEECAYNILFERETGHWKIGDKYEAGDENTKETNAEQVFKVLEARGPSPLDEVAKVLDSDPRVVRRVAAQLQQEGRAIPDRKGIWAVMGRRDDQK